MDYDHKWEYTVNNETQTVNGVNAINLSAAIAWSRDLEAKNNANKDLPQNWSKDEFMLWRRNEYNIWKKSGAAALASSVITNTTATTTTTGSTSSKDDRTRLNDFNKTSKAEKDYEVLKNEEYFYGWKQNFERKVQVHKYKRILQSNFDDTEKHRLSLTNDSYDLELFDEQVNFLSIVFQYTLRTVKGMDLVQLYPNDPIQLWQKLLYHHKGSDASTEAASKLLQRLFTIDISHFATKALFLQEYNTIIDYYNKTNTAVMQNSMKLQFLRLAITQDKELYQSYTSYLTSKRTAGGLINTAYVPEYGEFFGIVKQTAELLDSTKRNTRSNNKRMTRSTSRGGKPNYRANRADSFQDLSSDDSFDSNISEDNNLDAFAAIQGCDDGDMAVLEAYAAYQQQQRRRPKEGGVRIPREIYSTLTPEFKKGWDSITAEQQQQIAKDKFPRNNARSNNDTSQVQVYRTHQYISNEDVEAMYLVSRANSIDYADESSYDIASDYSEGEIIENTETNEELTVNKATHRPLRKAKGMQGTRTRKPLPSKSALPVGAAMKLLAKKATPVVKGGKIVGHTYYHPKDTSNVKANMAISYEHFFSDIDCEETNKDDDEDNIATYQTVIASQRVLKEIIRALIDGGANGGIGGRDMLIIAWHPGNRKVNIGIAGDHQMTGLPLAIFAAYIMSND